MASQDPKTFLWSNIALLMGTGSPTVDSSDELAEEIARWAEEAA